MGETSRLRKSLAALALVVAFVVVLASTGPRPSTEISGSIPRRGGVCLELERWTLFSWSVVGQTYTVEDVASGAWHEAVDDPPCVQVSEQNYRIRMPADAPYDVYRLCGLADDQQCLQFKRVPFEGTPGP